MFPSHDRGAHGIGKSELAYAVAKELGLPVVEKRLSQMSEGDFLGIPFREDGKYTKFTPMFWLWKASSEPVVLFLDEIDRADRQLRQAAFQLMDSRTVNGVKLHPDTVIIGAINGGIHGKHYMVQPMDPAELSRYSVIDLQPSQKEWIDWAERTKVHDGIISFIRNNPKFLEHDKQFEPDKVYPCRRSWARLSSVIKDNALNTAAPAESPEEDILFHTAMCFVGVETATAFTKFLRQNSLNLTIGDLLAGNLEKYYGKLTHTQINEIFHKLENCRQLKGNLKDNELKNLARFYLQRS